MRGSIIYSAAKLLFGLLLAALVVSLPLSAQDGPPAKGADATPPASQDPGGGAPGKAPAPADAGPGKAKGEANAPAKGEPAKGAAARDGSPEGKPSPADAGPGKAKGGANAPAKDGPAKGAAAKDGSPKEGKPAAAQGDSGPGKAKTEAKGPAKADPAKDGAAKDEPAQEPAAKAEQPDLGRVRTSGKDPGKDGPASPALTEAEADKLYTEAETLFRKGLFQQAMEGYWGAAAAFGAARGERDPKTLEAKARHNLSALRAGYFPESIAVSKELLPTLQGALPPDSPSLLLVQDTLGLGYMYNDDDQLALDYFTELHASRLAKLGKDNPSTLLAQRNVIIAKRLVGAMVAQDVDILRGILKAQEGMSGADDPEAIETKFQMAFSQYLLLTREEFGGEKANELKRLLREVLAARLKLYGETHPDVSEVIAADSYVEESEGKTAEAIRSLQRVKAIEGATLGPDHPWSVNTYLLLAGLEKKSGDFDKALADMEEALGARLRFYGRENEKTIQVRHMEADLYFNDLNDPEKALGILHFIFDWKEKNLGPDDPGTLDSLLELADLYDYMGKLDDSLRIYNKLLDARMGTYGPDSEKTLDISGRLAFHHYLEGNIQKAQDQYEALLAKYVETLGPDHDDTLETQLFLGSVYSNNSNDEKAREILERTLASYERLKGPLSPETLRAKAYLAKTYSNLGDLPKAIAIAAESLAAREALPDADVTETTRIRNFLVGLYLEAKDYGSAVPQLETLAAQLAETAGADALLTMKTRLLLATAYRQTGERAKSKAALLSLLKDAENSSVQDDSFTSQVRNELALVF